MYLSAYFWQNWSCSYNQQIVVIPSCSCNLEFNCSIATDNMAVDTYYFLTVIISYTNIRGNMSISYKPAQDLRKGKLYNFLRYTPTDRHTNRNPITLLSRYKISICLNVPYVYIVYSLRIESFITTSKLLSMQRWMKLKLMTFYSHKLANTLFTDCFM